MDLNANVPHKESTPLVAAARMPIIDAGKASGETARFFESVTNTQGRVPNSARVWAYLPYIVKFQQLSGGAAVLWAEHVAKNSARAQ